MSRKENDKKRNAAGMDRRSFVKMATAGTALAAAGCASESSRKLIPFVTPPESLVPGVALWYKTTCRECPAGCGLLVRTREGRTLKVEGNPDHPVNRGKLCLRGQAAVQGLYNPDRLAQPLRCDKHGRLAPASWEEAETLLADVISYLLFQKQAQQIGLWSHRITGSLNRLFAEFLAALGSKDYQIYETLAYEPLRAAHQNLFGTSEIPRYNLAAANALISFGADFLETWISNTGLAVDFAEFRKLKDGRVGKFIHVEARQSLTAANADEWIGQNPGTEGYLALGMAHTILKNGWDDQLNPRDRARVQSYVAPFNAQAASQICGVAAEKIIAMAKLFADAKPGLAIGGGVATQGSNATFTQSAIGLLNYICGNVGKTLVFGEGTNWDNAANLKDITATLDRMSRGEIQLMFFHHTNPAHTFPAGLRFEERLRKVPFKVSFSNVLDETAALCDLVLPDLDPLERWEDYSPRAGVHGIVQPTMQSLFQAKAAPDVFLSVAQRLGGDLAKKFPQKNFREYMEVEWKRLHRELKPSDDFDAWFRSTIEAGGCWTPTAPKAVKLTESAFGIAPVPPKFEGAGEFYLIAYPSIHFYDGRGANRPWLQETPDPLTKIVWDSWIEIHPVSAARLGIQESDLVKVTSPQGAIQVPAHLTASIRPDAVAIPIGQGHRQFGRYAKDRGVNVLDLLSPDFEASSGGRLWASTKVQLEKLSVHRPLVSVQPQETQAGRSIAQTISLAALQSSAEPHAESTAGDSSENLHMYATHEHPEHRWGMVVDLNACVGCNACVVACYAENNVAVVGRDQVSKGRHMAWIRIERYIEAGGENPAVHFLPMMCQQCDNAPCESVCPVYATYHNNEGLNAQIYNRCVGTRYCSNNCPYHVRRFNWFDYEYPYPLTVQLNPDLTVRSKGVMEKCTFCVQRIRAAKDIAKDEARPVRDGEIVPACAQTCPASAIVFGDLKDPRSRASQLARDPRRYHVLAELNVKPAVTYLKKIRNDS